MTPYQEGYVIGERVKVARIPRHLTRAGRAQWRSGFHDAQAARIARQRNEARTLAVFGLIPRGA